MPARAVARDFEHVRRAIEVHNGVKLQQAIPEQDAKQKRDRRRHKAWHVRLGDPLPAPPFDAREEVAELALMATRAPQRGRPQVFDSAILTYKPATRVPVGVHELLNAMAVMAVRASDASGAPARRVEAARKFHAGTGAMLHLGGTGLRKEAIKLTCTREQCVTMNALLLHRDGGDAGAVPRAPVRHQSPVPRARPPSPPRPPPDPERLSRERAARLAAHDAHEARVAAEARAVAVAHAGAMAARREARAKARAKSRP
jgi:hypothetical protein